ncbi:hypothetical protein [Geomonas propionica]|uniref:Uncharacterized protein n=1 Tax=Geomonas propionica TaxID=2798582 RepID=A0ABS0YKZ7_9BACT|nr:hypothetical protein [Geomonas propionica]MBJ6798633.1 hypothetical protein [Geomonas propionica]
MAKEKVAVREAIQEIHQRYVQELAKVEFLTQSFKAMVDNIGSVGINLDGFVLAMTDAVEKMADLNDDLDRVRFD